jgi:hypothetical protein
MLWCKQSWEMAKHVELGVRLITWKNEANYNVQHACCTLLQRCNQNITTRFLYICTFHYSFLGCRLFPFLLRSGAIRYNLDINFLPSSAREHETAESTLPIANRYDIRYHAADNEFVIFQKCNLNSTCTDEWTKTV